VAYESSGGDRTFNAVFDEPEDLQADAEADGYLRVIAAAEGTQDEAEANWTEDTNEDEVVAAVVPTTPVVVIALERTAAAGELAEADADVDMGVSGAAGDGAAPTTDVQNEANEETEPATADAAIVPAPAAEDTNMQDEPAAEGASTATGNLEPDTGANADANAEASFGLTTPVSDETFDGFGDDAGVAVPADPVADGTAAANDTAPAPEVEAGAAF